MKSTRFALAAVAVLSFACAEDPSGDPADAGPEAPDAAPAESGPDAGRTDASLARDASLPGPDAGPKCGQCVPDCTDRQCGPDGCGGSCGTCPSSQDCLFGNCLFVDPTECELHMCGRTQFGDCGTCPAGWTCNDDRYPYEPRTPMLCTPDAGCSEPGWSKCINGWLATCLDGEMVYRRCPYTACTTDAQGQGRCADVPCLPNCFGKTCGGDGCGGSCGPECPANEHCDATSSICIPLSCDAVPAGGRCSGHTRITCESGRLAYESCLAQGKVCGLDPCDGAYRCVKPAYDAPCEALPAAGLCEGEHLFRCYSGRLNVDNCPRDGHTCQRVSLGGYGCVYP